MEEHDTEKVDDPCDIDFAPYALTEEEQALICLFPEGKPNKKRAAEWKELFGS